MNNTGNSYRTHFPDPDWHEIAERASTETDPKKLAQLVRALCDRLYELRRTRFPDQPHCEPTICEQNEGRSGLLPRPKAESEDDNAN